MKPLITALSLAIVGVSSAQTIICPADAPPNVKLAAKEIRRYIYLRTGNLPPIAESGTGFALKLDPALEAQQYRLTTDGITGGSEIGVLYGAYRYAELLGVRFAIDGDVIPDERLHELPVVKEETGKPLFALRGLQPFHDFPEGPDWWTTDDWKSIISQATKMRMNFIGLHTYPFHNADLGPEPTVWVGLAQDVNANGTVKVADHASWYTTAKPMPYGCYAPATTGSYGFGAAEVFPTDNYGPEVNGPDDFPMPKTPAAKVAMINRSGRMLNEVFTAAHRLGMKVAVGTEAPLDIPDTAKARLQELGMNPDDPATLQQLYAGLFTRIQRTYPIDYYWLWGHEGDLDVKRFVANVQAAHRAVGGLGSPFQLGICGWGWTAGHFPELDQQLPKDVVFSAISMSTGHAPISENFNRLEGRQKWAIPWFEDDGALTSIQLRAGRMRRDAVDARRQGCTGLMGLHWRTRILGPNISALAQAGWEQGAWSQPPPVSGKPQAINVSGGQTASFLNDKVAGTANDPIYQTVRFNLRGYRFAVPNGRYQVTLRFVEPAYQESGKRVFGVNLQGEAVVRQLDVFAAVGRFAALDKVFSNINVTQGELRIDFVPEVEYPCIAAIDVIGNGVTRKVNCGGPEYQDYAADPNPAATPRDLPVGDFYADWAAAQFGGAIGADAAAIFTKLDGNFPTPSAWIRGPGGIVINRQPWAQLAPRFAFVEQFAALRPRVQGAGNLERFDWWLNTFRVTQCMGQFGCARGELDTIVERIGKEPNPQVKQQLAREDALPVRLRMVALLGDLHNALLATLHNATELGTLCNIQQQSMLRLQVLTGQDAALGKLLGEPLPATGRPWQDYRGARRLVVMNARTAAGHDEALTLKIIALAKAPVTSVVVHLRPLGKGAWQSLTAKHVGRAVYETQLPAAREDFEYYITAGEHLSWPAAAPQLNQTVVIMPTPESSPR